MVWLLSKHDDETIKQIERQSDRSAAILASACLEDRLDKFLRSALREDKLAERLFKGYGPLSSFQAKIDIC